MNSKGNKTKQTEKELNSSFIYITGILLSFAVRLLQAIWTNAVKETRMRPIRETCAALLELSMDGVVTRYQEEDVEK